MINRTAIAQRLVKEGRKGHKGIRVSESSCVSPGCNTPFSPKCAVACTLTSNSEAVMLQKIQDEAIAEVVLQKRATSEDFCIFA
ncbi:MAG: hypothetical protein V7K92_12405 [Nostoc sp.]|uniref:hypothetical protein n=1 Tax=Nostoc sp. TaxID=1180 RepID=UPI002FEFF63A